MTGNRHIIPGEQLDDHNHDIDLRQVKKATKALQRHGGKRCKWCRAWIAVDDIRAQDAAFYMQTDKTLVFGHDSCFQP